MDDLLQSKKQSFTPQEVAEVIGVSTKHVYECIRSGAIKALDVSAKGKRGSKSIRILRSTVIEFINSRTIPPEVLP